MPENIAKYSLHVVQQIANPAVDPSNALLAWIVAWAFAEPNELLATQIRKQVKVELPGSFEEAFNQAMQKASDPSFRAAAIGAFGMAISKFRVREDIKALAYDAPTERVLEGLRKIANELPKLDILNALIRDVEYIQQMRAGAMPIPKTQEQIAPRIEEISTPTPPSAPQYPAQQPEQKVQYPAPTQTVSISGDYAPSPPMKLEDLKAALIDIVDSTLGNKIDELTKMVKELSGALEPVEASINLLKKKVDEISLEIQNIKDSIESLRTSTQQPETKPETRTSELKLEVVRALEEAAKLIGFEISAPPEVHPQVEIPTSIAEGERRDLTPLQLPTKTGPEEAKAREIPPREVPPIISPTKTVPERPPVTAPPPPLPPMLTKPKPRDVKLLVSLLGDAESLKKAASILLNYKIEPFRWEFTETTDDTNLRVTVQALVKSLPPSRKKELLQKAQGVILMSEGGLPEGTSEVLRLFENIKFIILSGSKPQIKIPMKEVVIESGPIDSKEDLVKLLQRVLQKVKL
ncbi:MAG: hypothetical protein NDP22_00440 [Crenarchaeota archaeon]|nr:hypothetical protein [Thermoproteota archaeon]